MISNFLDIQSHDWNCLANNQGSYTLTSFYNLLSYSFFIPSSAIAPLACFCTIGGCIVIIPNVLSFTGRARGEKGLFGLACTYLVNLGNNENIFQYIQYNFMCRGCCGNN